MPVCTCHLGALTYLKAAKALLPENCWDSHYDLSMSLNFQLANSAYPCTEIDIAKDALAEIDLRARCLEDKFDANYLLVKVLHHDAKDLPLALSTCRRMLSLLGEPIPSESEISTTDQFAELGMTRMACASTASEYMLSLPQTDCRRLNNIARFYVLLALISYTLGNETEGWLCAY